MSIKPSAVESREQRSAAVGGGWWGLPPSTPNLIPHLNLLAARFARGRGNLSSHLLAAQGAGTRLSFSIHRR